MIQSMYYPFFFGLGGPIGSGKQPLPWIHIDDLCRLIQFSAENEKVRGALNAVAPEVVTNEQFSKVSSNFFQKLQNKMFCLLFCIIF